MHVYLGIEKTLISCFEIVCIYCNASFLKARFIVWYVKFFFFSFLDGKFGKLFCAMLRISYFLKAALSTLAFQFLMDDQLIISFWKSTVFLLLCRLVMDIRPEKISSQSIL